MKEWEKVGHFAKGIVYACGKERKLVIPNYPVIHLEMDTKKVWWRQNTIIGLFAVSSPDFLSRLVQNGYNYDKNNNEREK
jgi:hypothetical protein